jgi:hypothetical protein
MVPEGKMANLGLIPKSGDEIDSNNLDFIYLQSKKPYGQKNVFIALLPP